MIPVFIQETERGCYKGVMREQLGSSKGACMGEHRGNTRSMTQQGD